MPIERSSLCLCLPPNLYSDWEQWQRDQNSDLIRWASRELGSPYQIAFVTERGLPESIARVEEDISAVSLVNWPLPPISEQSARSTTVGGHIEKFCMESNRVLGSPHLLCQ